MQLPGDARVYGDRALALALSLLRRRRCHPPGFRSKIIEKMPDGAALLPVCPATIAQRTPSAHPRRFLLRLPLRIPYVERSRVARRYIACGDRFSSQALAK